MNEEDKRNEKVHIPKIEIQPFISQSQSVVIGRVQISKDYLDICQKLSKFPKNLQFLRLHETSWQQGARKVEPPG